jgi:hypothetical protein
MPQFSNMNELVEYLGSLENRVKALETENTNLRAIQPKSKSVDGNAIARYVSRVLPQTSLLSNGFFKRAFAVWGHFFVASLIIGTILGILYTCLMIAMFGSMFGNFVQQVNP